MAGDFNCDLEKDNIHSDILINSIPASFQSLWILPIPILEDIHPILTMFCRVDPFPVSLSRYTQMIQLTIILDYLSSTAITEH